MAEPNQPRIVPFEELPHSADAHRFEGRAHGDVPVSVILVHAGPGGGPQLHRHPYVEVFIVESGEATFRVGDESIEVGGGHVVVAPADVPHQFTNTGQDELRVVAIHPSPRYLTEWIADDEPS